MEPSQTYKRPWVVTMTEQDGSIRWCVTKGFWRGMMLFSYGGGILAGFFFAILYGVSQRWCGWAW